MQPTDSQTIINQLASHYAEIIRLVGEDVTREGLIDTPQRAAKAIYYATRGYRQNIDDVIHGAMFQSPGSGIVTVKDIEFYSICEHHLLPFFGTVSIAYLPGAQIIGLSKVARIVDMFARRFQVQERFTNQLCEELTHRLGAKGVLVKSTARHLCMQMRGVQKQMTSTDSIAVSGVFQTDPALAAGILSSL